MARDRRLIAVAVAASVLSARADDWPQYLGPSRDATSAETGLARAWPEGGPQVLWTVELGKGFSGAAVRKGLVYIHDRAGANTEMLRCLELDSGREAWRCEYEAPGPTRFPGARCVPALDGERAYVCGPSGGVHCVDTKTHAKMWERNFWAEFGGGEKLPMWAVGQNPLVWRDLLIIASQTPKTGVVALDKATGATKWTTPPLSDRTGYVSPTVVEIGGKDQVVMISAGPPNPNIRFGRGRGGRGGRGGPPKPPPGGPPQTGTPPGGKVETAAKGAVVGIDPAAGKILWRYEGWQCQTPVPNVTAIGDGRLFITGGYKAGSAMIRVELAGEEYSVSEVYTTQAFATHVHPPVLHRGHLYGHCSTNTGRSDGLMCMDLDGNVKWKSGNAPYFDKGGMLLADGLLLTLDGRKGVLYLIEPDPAELKVLASASVLATPQCWAPLALSDGKLLVRDQKQLRCVKVR